MEAYYPVVQTDKNFLLSVYNLSLPQNDLIVNRRAAFLTRNILDDFFKEIVTEPGDHGA